MKEFIFVYGGRHYGRKHLVLARKGRTVEAIHQPSGDRLEVNECDTEKAPESPS